MSVSLSGRVARALRVLAVVLVLATVGCAGSGERLPSCRGRPMPINTGTNAAVPVAPSSQTDAH